MARTISVAALAEMAKKTGTEPVNIIEIEWVEGTYTSYADKIIDGTTSSILQLDNINELIAVSNGVSTAQIGVVLDDTNGTIKALLDKYDLHMRPLRVYQWFDGLDQDDKFLVFDGMVVSPIVWSEGQRQVSFQAITKNVSKEVGFAPEEGQYADVPHNLVGQVWPLCFGSPIHVPAVKATSYKVGTLLNIVGRPDPTLPLKRDLLIHRRDRLVESYNFFVELIDECKKIARPAYEIQHSYAHHIVAYDHLKQTLEDLSINLDELTTQLSKAYAEWNNAFSNLDKYTVEQHINQLNASLNERRNLLKKLYAQRRQFETREESYEIELDNVKYEISVINRLRNQLKKITEQYYNTVRELSGLERAIEAQSTLQSAKAAVMDGTIFPQNQSSFYSIMGVRVAGSMNGYGLSIDTIQPTYRNVALDARQSEDLDTIWIADSNIKLEGKYILTQDRRIIKITSQQGKLCKIDLPRKNKSKRSKARHVDYAGDNAVKEQFNTTMNRLIAGNESDEYKAFIADTLPTDISPAVWDILQNKSRKQKITLISSYGEDSDIYHTNFDTSYFQLYYGDEEVSELIKFTDSAMAVKDKIVGSMLSVDPSDIRVSVHKTFGAYNIGFTIEIVTGILKPFRLFLNNVNTDNLKTSDRLVITSENADPDTCIITTSRSRIHEKMDHLVGDLDFIIGTYAFSIDANVATGPAIQAKINLSNLFPQNSIVVTGGPIGADDITVTYNEDFVPLLVYTNGLGQEDIDDNTVGDALDVWVETVNGVASEYTKRERSKKIEEELEESIHSKAVLKYRDAIRETRKKFREMTDYDESQLQEIKKEFAKNLEQYASTIRRSHTGYSTDTDEAYKVISEQERKLLYELELIGYVEWVNTLRNLDEELEEEIDYDYTALNITSILEVSPIILDNWVNTINGKSKFDRLKAIEQLPNNTQAWVAQVGDRVMLDGDFSEKYVANILPSTIHSVYAYRNNNGIKQLTPVPTAYYTKNEADDYGKYSCTTITLQQPLKDIDPNWDDTLYVTLTSSVGPNVVDVIQWIIENFTNGTVDETSFDHVKELQENYPCHFALFDKRDAIELIKDIAHQARCYIWQKFNVFQLRYAPEIPTPVATLTDSNIEENSIELYFTPTEEITTKLVATYVPDYTVEKPWQLIVRRNLTKYEELVKTVDYFIYNNRDLVYKSITFWLIHWSNTYKHARCKIFLDNLNVETYDAVNLDIGRPIFADTAVIGLVRSSDYDATNRSIALEIWLPVLSGTMETYRFAWPKDLTVTDIFPEAKDIVAGNAGNPISVYVPSNTDFDPYDPDLLDIRPKDFGKAKISDTDDEIPGNPAEEFQEMNYYSQDNTPIQISFDPSGEPTADYVAEFFNGERTGQRKRKTPPDGVVFHGIIVNGTPAKTEEVDMAEINGGVNVVEYRPNRDYYDVALANGRQVKARLFRLAETGKVKPGTPVIVIYDMFSSDYVFQIPITQQNGGPL